jgi:hypothetical protein
VTVSSYRYYVVVAGRRLCCYFSPNLARAVADALGGRVEVEGGETSVLHTAASRRG